MDRKVNNNNNSDTNDNNNVARIVEEDVVVRVTSHKSESPLKDTSKFSLRKGKRLDQARLASSLQGAKPSSKDDAERTSSSSESGGERDSKGIKRGKITEHPTIQGKGKRKEKSVEKKLLKKDEFKKTSRKNKNKESDKVKSELAKLFQVENNQTQSKKEMNGQTERIEQTEPIEYVNLDREERKQQTASRQQSQREAVKQALRNCETKTTPKNLSAENLESSQEVSSISATTFDQSNLTFYFGDRESSTTGRVKCQRPHFIKERLLVKKRVLGEGASCVVKRGVLIYGDGRDSEKVAVKIYKSDQDSQITHDLNYLDFKHENLLQYKGFVFGKDKKPRLVSELCPTNLRTYIEKKQVKCVEGKDRKKWKRASIKIAHKIARGLHYIHSEGKIHCDIKPENVLLQKRKDKMGYIPKLGDFGSVIESSASSLEGYGTRDYRSPEVWKCFLDAKEEHKNPLHKPTYEFDSKLDIYSFGMTCWSIFHPFDEIWGESNDNETRDKVLGGKRPEIDLNSCPRRMEKLIKRCWHQDPTKRPSSGEIVQFMERHYGKYF